MTFNEFITKYSYIENVTNVTLPFDIKDPDQVFNTEAPEGDTSLTELDFERSESTYLLIENNTGNIVKSSTDPADIVDYIKHTLKVEDPTNETK